MLLGPPPAGSDDTLEIGDHDVGAGENRRRFLEGIAATSDHIPGPTIEHHVANKGDLHRSGRRSIAILSRSCAWQEGEKKKNRHDRKSLTHLSIAWPMSIVAKGICGSAYLLKRRRSSSKGAHFNRDNSRPHPLAGDD